MPTTNDNPKMGKNPYGDTVILCRTCGCHGDMLCGHDPVPGRGCELDATDQCYCCRGKRKRMVK